MATQISRQFLAEYILNLTEVDVPPPQGVAAGYMQYGYNEVMVRSSGVNVSKAHQLFALLGKKGICPISGNRL